MNASKKFTKATLKSFVKKNIANLYISKKRSFDSMTDGCESCADKSFQPVTLAATFHENTLGIEGCWLVGGGRDYFTLIEKDGFSGVEVSNCCGLFILAIKAA